MSVKHERWHVSQKTQCPGNVFPAEHSRCNKNAAKNKTHPSSLSPDDNTSKSLQLCQHWDCHYILIKISTSSSG